MKGRTIVLDHLGDIEAAALMVDGKLEDLLVDTPDAARSGTVYRAIADRPVKGQGGMFLKTPDGMAFLRQIKGCIMGRLAGRFVELYGPFESARAGVVGGQGMFPITVKFCVQIT